MRQSRKTGILGSAKSPLLDLFSSAVIAGYSGFCDGSNTGTATVTVDGGTTDPVWAISCTGRGIAFAKVKNNTVSVLKTSAMVQNPTSVVITASQSWSNTKITSGAAYGVFLLAARFPGYTESEVDALLSGMTVSILAGRSATSAAVVYTPASSVLPAKKNLYLQMFSVRDGWKDKEGFSIVAGNRLDAAVVGLQINIEGSPPWWHHDSSYYYIGSGESDISANSAMIVQMK